MQFFLDRLLRSPDEGAAAAAPASAAPAAPAAPADGNSAAAANPAAAGSGAAVDPPAAVPPSAAGDVYRPDGLPDHMLGKTNNETIDNLKKTVDGYRTRDAEMKIPDTAEAYGEFAGDIPDTVKPHLETLKDDPLFGRVAAKALELRVPLPAYQGLVQEFISVSAEMGMMEPVVDAAAERAALVPDVARHLPDAEQKAAVERRMNENYAFVDALVTKGAANGGLSKDDAEFAKAMLGDSAKGHRVFEWMRATAGGGQGGGGPAMQFGQPGAADPKADISRRAALAENTWGDPKYNEASYNQLQADRRRVYGD